MAEAFGFRGGESYSTMRRRIRAEMSAHSFQNTENNDSWDEKMQFLGVSENSFSNDIDVEFKMQTPEDPFLNDDHDFEIQSTSSEESETLSEADCSDISLGEQLAGWATTFNITNTSLSPLLSILNVFHTDLPLDARTLLRTLTIYPIHPVGTCGEMSYFGIATGIIRLADKGALFGLGQKDSIQLQFNVDGLPLFKSSNMQLWPILCLVKCLSVKKPFVVAAYCGIKNLQI